MSELVLSQAIQNPKSGRPLGHQNGDVVLASTERFHGWYWLVVPVLAALAYVTVLRIGFLGDDPVLLIQAHRLNRLGLNLGDFLPQPDWPFYRPLGLFLTWRLGSYLWGYNPLPYHLQGLLLHAGVALLLGLWLAEATYRRSLGWLSGALFAVFPLHLEAVGWLAAQWDLWAAFFSMLSLWLFTLWLRTPKLRLYLLSLLFYLLGLFSKESLLAFLPLFALSAWLALPRLNGQGWRRLGLALIPFCMALFLNLAVRFLAWGSIGGYQNAQPDPASFFWDALISFSRFLIVPLNATIWGNVAVQVTGALASSLLLLGLVWHGRQYWRILLVCSAWTLFSLIPVLNLPVGTMDLQNNRLLYLASAGYCVVVAVLLHSVAASFPRRGVAISLIGLLLGLGIVVSWVQLRPWHTATVQATALEQELYQLIPVQARPKGLVWYLEWYLPDSPDNYKGAYVFRKGMDELRQIMYGEGPVIELAREVNPTVLVTEQRDAYTLGFHYSLRANRFYVDHVAGITFNTPPPRDAEPGGSLTVWDFRGCASGTLGSWKALDAKSTCEANTGLTIQPTNADPMLIGPDMNIDPNAAKARFVRLRVSARYLPGAQTNGRVNQWFWKGPGEDWQEESSKTLLVKPDGNFHVYWTFIPASEVMGALSSLRLDPINNQTACTIAWIAADMVDQVP